MNREVQLSDQELNLIVNLLKEERSNLPAEIHHTQTYSRQMKSELDNRKELVDSLLEKLASRSA